METKGEKRKAYLKAYKKEYDKSHVDIRISVTLKDYKAFKLVAEKRGQKVTSFFRDAAIAQAQHVYLFPEEITKQATQLARDIHGVSRNANQLTRYVHEENRFLAQALEGIFKKQVEIKEKLDQILKILNISKGG